MSNASAFAEVIEQLWSTIEQRRTADPEVSYTAQLLQGPEDSLLKKIGEEATEVVMAAKDGDLAHLRYEVTDLTYHLLVVMLRWGLDPDDLAEELASRFK